ncbi:hypothetical protein Bca52824_058112 [Brassica carinata]|uniref:Uncharacterized protein n=1 Tax=Brassica carinata TaxID=52824 RepID=A0A8X7QSI8_BRACI|nr:hypothetical protein Bca52824_058112 [Brassica carinata]
MLIHRSSAIASVLGDHKRQMLRELMGVDMLLLDSKVKTEVTLNQGLSHHQFQINVTGKLNLLSSRFTFSFSFVLVLLREARLRDRSVAAKKSTAAGGLKSVLKNPTGSKSSGSSFEDDDEVGELYERIEGAKQRMMIELDTPMMEAAQELELWSLKDPSLASVELLLQVRSCTD